jgi:hypothetical protein
MNYAIDDNIPVPTRGRTASAELRAMRQLDVGQSFLVQDWQGANRVRFHQCKEPGKKFAMRKIDGGWRVWRTE